MISNLLVELEWVVRSAETFPLTLSDQFRFDPETITVDLGETRRLSFQNTGQQTHEWIFGTAFEISEYMEMMRRFPGKEKNAPQNI